MDFYSQRLRQLVGTSTPGTNLNTSNSPSPRKQQQLWPTALTSISRLQSLTPPKKHTELGELDSGTLTKIQRSNHESVLLRTSVQKTKAN